MENYDNDLKIVVIGEGAGGKTSFTNRWAKNIFPEKYKYTIISEFGFKIYEKDEKLYPIEIWDLASQDKKYAVTKIFAKDADGYVVVSNVTDIQTREM